jgi:hypothetical protein
MEAHTLRAGIPKAAFTPRAVRYENSVCIRGWGNVCFAFLIFGRISGAFAPETGLYGAALRSGRGA